jgi:drug/metabolite transporter (DMT)-like permease
MKEGPRELAGFGFGILGILGFSMTVPATRAAVPELGGAVVGLGRALVAALLAAVFLLVVRKGRPARRHWPGLAVVALGVVVGFPLFSSLALAHVPASHAAVVVGLLPAMTAVMAALRAGERPPPAFWAACCAGVISVLAFAAAEGAGRPRPEDGLLLAAIGLAGLGYAEGGRLARELGGARVICWALLLAAPFLALPVMFAIARDGLTAGPEAWLGFAYVSMVSMFLAFFAWYRGLALGGVARVGQVQLAQPVLSLAWAALFLGEKVGPWTIAASLLVVGSVALTRLSWRPARPPAPIPSRQATKPTATGAEPE